MVEIDNFIPNKNIAPNKFLATAVPSHDYNKVCHVSVMLTRGVADTF